MYPQQALPSKHCKPFHRYAESPHLPIAKLVRPCTVGAEPPQFRIKLHPHLNGGKHKLDHGESMSALPNSERRQLIERPFAVNPLEAFRFERV